MCRMFVSSMQNWPFTLQPFRVAGQPGWLTCARKFPHTLKLEQDDSSSNSASRQLVCQLRPVTELPQDLHRTAR